MTAVGSFGLRRHDHREETLLLGVETPGYPSLMVVVLFLGGIQLMALGVIGEYLGRTFNEVKTAAFVLRGIVPPPPPTRSCAAGKSEERAETYRSLPEPPPGRSGTNRCGDAPARKTGAAR